MLGDIEHAPALFEHEDAVEDESGVPQAGLDDLGGVRGVVVAHPGVAGDASPQPEVAWQDDGVGRLDLDRETLAVGAGEGAIAAPTGGGQPVMVVHHSADRRDNGLFPQVPGCGMGDLVIGQARGRAMASAPDWWPGSESRRKRWTSMSAVGGFAPAAPGDGR